MDSVNATKGWHCNCVAPCPHADQGEGWYITTRREHITTVEEAIYYVWAESPSDAIVKLNASTTVRTERAVQRVVTRSVQPISEWTPACYDFNEGMGR